VLTIAAVWVSATSVLRAAEWLAPRLPALGRILRFTPAGALVAPLEGYRAGGAAAAAAAFVPLGALAAGALVLAAVIARRAGMRGWEEAGAPFAEASAAPRSAPPLGLVRREWRLLLRDRPRLLSLVALPGTFIGVQLVGSAGWAWTTASVDRVAMVTFSFVLYIATLGPLAHMQGERRAFWIAYTVPVPLGTLMAAKVKAWAPILAGTAAAVFLALATQLPDASAGDLARAGILVVAGAVAMTAMAVAFAAATADLSDPQRGAIGPGAVYLFLFMGGLYNIILVERGWGVAPLLALYGGVTAATWRAGMVRAACCFDAEALARRPVRLADAAILLLATALFPRAAGSGLAAAGAGSDAPATARATALVVVAIAAAVYLARRERRGAIPSPAVALAAGIAAGVGGAVLLRLAGVEAPAAGTVTGGVVLAVIVAGALAEELVLRGVVQRAVEEELHACFSRFANPLEPRQLPGRQARIRHASRWLAAAVALAATLVVVPGPPAAVAVIALAPTVARATGGTMWAAVLARAIVVFVIVSGSGLSGG
jgi:hypothetical protein